MQMEKDSGGEAKLQNTENSKPQNRFGFATANPIFPFPDRLFSVFSSLSDKANF
jgi:hypothetical protein